MMPATNAFLNLTLVLGTSMYVPAKNSHTRTTDAKSSRILMRGERTPDGSKALSVVDMNTMIPDAQIIRTGRIRKMAV